MFTQFLDSGLGLCCRADSSFQIFIYTAVGLCFEFHSFIIGFALTCPLPPLPWPQDTGRVVKDMGHEILASILVPCLLLSDCGLGHTSCFFEKERLLISDMSVQAFHTC